MINKKKVNDSTLYEFVYNKLEKSQFPINIFKELEKKYTVILFGGSVRDYIVFKGNYEVRDFDFVIAGMENKKILKDMFKKYFTDVEFGYNQFGGLKMVRNNLMIDYWRLEDTQAFRKGKVKVALDNLLETPMLNIDRYAYNMSKKKYIAHCNLRLLPGEVDFALYDEDCLEINLVRAMVYSKKYHIKMSNQVIKKLQYVLSNEERTREMQRLQMYHFNELLVDIHQMVLELSAGGGSDD